MDHNATHQIANVPGGAFNVDDDELDAPFAVAPIPAQYDGDEGHSQENVGKIIARCRQEGVPPVNYLQQFNSALARKTKLSSMKCLFDTKNSTDALRLLHDRCFITVDNDFKLNPTGELDMLMHMAGHFLDYVMYMGNRCGLDAALPNINTILECNHTDCVRSNGDTLEVSTSAMRREHSLMVTMFFAHILHSMQFEDVHCIEKIPGAYNTWSEAVDGCTKCDMHICVDIWAHGDAQFHAKMHNEPQHVLTLTLPQFRMLHIAFRNLWKNWSQGLQSSSHATQAERDNWNKDHDYENIMLFSFSLASHINFSVVDEWANVPPATILAREGKVFTAPPGHHGHQEIDDLANYDLLDEDGKEIPIYTAEGYMVLRCAPPNNRSTPGGAFLDLTNPRSVQLRRITAAVSGCTATGVSAVSKWERCLQECEFMLPHEQFHVKVTGGRQPQSMQFENTYRLEVSAMTPEDKNGSVIYDKVITPLIRTWMHPDVQWSVKQALVPLATDVVPGIFEWTTYPITCFLELSWNILLPQLQQPDVSIDPHIIEIISVFEQVLNYAHTGAAHVLVHALMYWSMHSWTIHGHHLDSCLMASPAFGVILSIMMNWSVDVSAHRPITSSHCMQELTYGFEHYELYIAHFTILHAIKNLPQHVYVELGDLCKHLACFAAEVGLCVYIADVMHLVSKEISKELHDIFIDEEDQINAELIHNRELALQRWCDSNNPLSYTKSTLMDLIHAISGHCLNYKGTTCVKVMPCAFCEIFDLRRFFSPKDVAI
ncbi:hypothetical protein F5141DRAFT_1065718 [Pisolithus sp. B1]|nr:hypothetical protein F5141DRAFT_1065718 [Pisolithus sp. B1]